MLDNKKIQKIITLIIYMVISGCSKQECVCKTTESEDGVVVNTEIKRRTLDKNEHCEITDELTTVQNGVTYYEITECDID